MTTFVEISYNIMIKTILSRSLLAVSACVLLFSSCVNEEYDLDKGIDTEMTILKNISMPVGDLEKIVLMDILEIEENSIIYADDNNDLVLSFKGDEMSTDIELPEVTIGNSIKTEPVIIHFSTGKFAGMDASIVAQQVEKISYSELTGKVIDTETEIDIDDELPEQIVSIRSIKLNADLSISFTVNAGSIHLANGLEIAFPADVKISKNDNQDFFEVTDGRIVKIVKDVNVKASSPLVLNFRLTEISVPDGAISNGKISLQEVLELKADFYLLPEDFTTIPDELVVEVDTDLRNMEVESADMIIDVDTELDDIEMEISDLPDFLSGENMSIDIYNPAIRLSVGNSSPFAFNVKADLTAYSKGVSTTPISIGSDPVMNIPAESEVDFVISRRGNAMAGNVVNLVVPDMMKLINPLPEKIQVSNLAITSVSDSYMTIVPGSRYSASIDYEIYAPLAFDSGMALSFDYDIEGLGLEFDGVTVPEAAIKMNLINSIPVGFDLSAQAVDSDGNTVDNVVLTVDKPIKAGSHVSPSDQEVTIKITNNGDTFSLHALRLHMSAKADNDYLGVSLNTAQGLEIKNLVFNLPEGITLKTDNESIDE